MYIAYAYCVVTASAAKELLEGVAYTVRFFVPLTTSRDHLHKLITQLDHSGQFDGFPFIHSIVSVLYCRPSTLNLLRQHSNECCVMFDSGGFYVQQGRESLISLASRLQAFYAEHDWADYYVLPDHPPAPNDSITIAYEKISNTLATSMNFYSVLSKELQAKTIGVVHAVSINQLDWSTDHYFTAGIKHLAFGSFSMSGPSHGVNKITYASLGMLLHLSAKIRDTDSRLHVFGIGSPAQLAIFHALGVASFDSAGWLRAAAFGSVYLPFLGAFNISRRTKSRLRSHLSESDFRGICNRTAHACHFCGDFTALCENWLLRALHNLLVMQETVAQINAGTHLSEQHRIEQLLEMHSPQFLRYWHFVQRTPS